MVLRKFSDWLGLNKPNKYKFIIAFALILLNFVSFFYVLSYALCDSPLGCPHPNALSNALAPVVGVTYYPFYIQNELADSIVYKITYINENTHTVERKYPVPVEYAIRAIFILFTLSIYLIFYYIISCAIYQVYKKKFAEK